MISFGKYFHFAQKWPTKKLNGAILSWWIASKFVYKYNIINSNRTCYNKKFYFKRQNFQLCAIFFFLLQHITKFKLVFKSFLIFSNGILRNDVVFIFVAKLSGFYCHSNTKIIDDLGKEYFKFLTRYIIY